MYELMLFKYDYIISMHDLKNDKKKALMLANRMLPEYVFDTAQLENNPITFPEVKTLMDGITIGGHKVSDVEQILNIKNAWTNLLNEIKSDNFSVSKILFNKINELVAKDEALYAGKFRNGSVGIAGTEKYKSPAFNDLDNIFDSELNTILNDFNPIEKAIRVFLWGSLNQFYWDGNKRTARIIANGILINEGIGIFNIKAKDILEFNTLMIDFYETQVADNIVKFLNEKAIVIIEE